MTAENDPTVSGSSQPPSATPPGNNVAPKPAPRRRKRRIILYALAFIVVAVVLLVALAPTIIGSGPVVSIITGQVNKQLNGKVSIDSLSLGWFSGVDVKGVHVFDASNTQIAGVQHVAVPMPLWKVATGSFALGTIPIDGVTFNAQIDANGVSNFQKLVKPSSSTPPPAAPKDSKPSKLPNISGDIKLTNCTGTITQVGKPKISLTKLDGEIKIPDINQPITDTLNVGIKVGDQPEGQLTVNGTAAAIKANLVAIDTADIHQTVDVQNLSLAAAKPFVPPDLLDTLDGVIGAHVKADLTNGKSAALDIAVAAKQKIVARGKALKGDTFTTTVFNFAVPQLSADFPNGPADWQSGRIKVGTDAGSSPILLQIDQGQLTLALDAMPQAILNLIANKKPGSIGKLTLTDHFDLGALARQLPHLLQTPEGVSVTDGALAQNVNVDWTADKTTLSKFTADVTDVKGQRKVPGVTAPVALSIAPIHVDIAGQDLGGLSDIPDLRDLHLSLQSKFANADLRGTTLADLKGKFHADLQVLKSELNQFVDLSAITIGGNVDVDISGTGTLTAPPRQATVAIDVRASNLMYSGGGTQLNEPLIHLTVGGKLQVDESQTPQTLKDVKITLQTGDTANPTVDVLLTAGNISLINGIAADFNLQHINADLSKLQKELANVPAGKSGVVVNNGSLTVSASGTYTPSKITLSAMSAGLFDLLVDRQLANGSHVAAIKNESVKFDLAAEVAQTPAAGSKGSDRTVRVTTMTLADTAGYLDVHKTGDALVVTQAAAGGIGGSGKIAVMAQLAPLANMAKALGQTEVAVKTSSGDLRSGKLDGGIELASTGPGKTSIDANFNVSNAVVTTPTGTLTPQTASLVLKATSDSVANTVSVAQIDLKTGFATAAISNVNVSLAAKSALDYVSSADWKIDIADLKQLMALKDAFATPTPAVASAATPVATPAPAAGKPAADDNASKPLVIDSGSVALQGRLFRKGPALQLDVPAVAVNGITFHRGTITYTAKPIAIKLAAAVNIVDGKTLMDQIGSATVTTLDGNLGIATLSMPTPITVTQLATTPQANGTIKVVGSLTDLTALAAAAGGQKPDAYPYAGDYTATENIISKQNAITLQGGVDVAKFQSFNGKDVTFSEDLLSAANDLSYITNGDDADVKISNLTVSMKSSGALNVTLANGGVQKLNTARIINLQPKVEYDLAKLWPIIQPMMGDSYKTLKIGGHYTKQFNVTGSYPANQPSTVAIKTLKADGDLAVESLDFNGLTIANLIVPVSLVNGKASTVYAGKPAGQNTAPPASANQGTLDLCSLTVDLSQDPPRLSTPPNKVVIKGLTINPVFANTYLTQVLNNPLFANTGNASGLFDLTITKAEDFPLSGIAMQEVPENTGEVDIMFSLTKLTIGLNGVSSALGSILKQDTFTGDIKNGVVTVAQGISTQNINFVSGSYTLGFDGAVRLSDQALMPMNMNISPVATILNRMGIHVDPNDKSIPSQFTVAVRGTVSKPQYDIGALGKLATDVAKGQLAKQGQKQLQNGLNKLLKGKNGGNNGNSNPLGNIFDQLNKKNQNQNQQPQPDGQ